MSDKSGRHFFISNSAHPCTEIALDANRIRKFYLANGWSEAADPSEADDLIVSTCAFNQQYEDAAIEDILNRRRQLKQGGRLITTGCLSKINPERFGQAGGEISVPPLEMKKFDSLVKGAHSISEVSCNAVKVKEYESNPLISKLVRLKTRLENLSKRTGLDLVPYWMYTIPSTGWFFIRGAIGCRGRCTYCAVRNAKGTLSSVPMESILRQTREAIAKGATEISLAGDDMGAWGSDYGWDLAELLTAMILVRADLKINIRFVEPLYFIRLFDKLAPLFATGRITAFCLPIQSGSNRILRMMGRDYTIEEIEHFLEKFSRISRRPRLASIIMVGFPGETWEDFLSSYRLIERLPIDMFQILEYEGRPNTPSIRLPGQIPDSEKHRRHDILLKKFKLQKIFRLPTGVVDRMCGI